LEFDVVHETLDKTNLNNIAKSDLVNLERSMTANSEIGGHLVSGHIHGTGKVLKVISQESNKRFANRDPVKPSSILFFTKAM
jgi:riboflavin synthase